MPAWSRAAIVLALALVYAACFALIKAGLAFAPPLRFAGLRALAGGLALLLLALLLLAPVVRARVTPKRRQVPGLVGLAVTATTISFAGMFLSPGRTATGIASVLGNIQPLILIVLGTWLLSEKLTLRKVLALGLGLAGVVLISYPAWSGPQAYGLSGPALAIMASGGAAAGSVIVKRMRPEKEVWAVTAWQLVLGSLPLLTASALLEPASRIVWSPEFVVMLAFLALVGTSLTSAVWYWLIQHEDVGRLSLFLFLVPLFGLAIGGLVLREPVRSLEAAGAVLTVGAALLVIRRS